MPFSTKRGRPSLQRYKRDTGTQELAVRHAKGLTMEPIDMCLKRDFISEEEHAAGLHLRWLYSLRFGAPSIRAYDHSDLGGKNTAMRDENWHSCRESEYEQAVKILMAKGAHIIVINTVVFNRFPRFLHPPKTCDVLGRNMKMAQEINAQEIALLKDGLALLGKEFAFMRQGKRRKLGGE